MNKLNILLSFSFLLVLLGCLSQPINTDAYIFEEKTIDFKNKIIRIYFKNHENVIDSTEIQKSVVPSMAYKGSKYWSCEYLYKFQNTLKGNNEDQFYSKAFNYILREGKIKSYERKKIAEVFVKLNRDLIISNFDSDWMSKHDIFLKRIDSLYKNNEVDICEVIAINNINYEITRNKTCLFFADKNIDINSNPFSIKKFYRFYERICISESESGYAEVSISTLSPNFRIFNE
ncbi:MAG: hypothetical protein KA340_08715 [Saprospiraceae bacterium]|nr:hypothetical protein [Saprospiraceae bacterium]